MPVSATWFGKGLLAVVNNDVDFTADTIKVSLHTASYTPNVDTHDFFDDATNELSTAGGYTAGGITLANKTAAYDAGTNEARLDADDIAWTSATFTVRYAVVRKARGGAASVDEVLGYVDFGGDEAVSSGTFTIAWAASGVLKLTVIP